jgi:hypothetical protein
LEKALKRERVAGSGWAEPVTCRGLALRLFLNAIARWLVASRNVLATEPEPALPGPVVWFVAFFG